MTDNACRRTGSGDLPATRPGARLALLVATHNLGFVKRYADQISVHPATLYVDLRCMEGICCFSVAGSACFPGRRGIGSDATWPIRKQKVHYIHRLTYTARERLTGAFVLDRHRTGVRCLGVQPADRALLRAQSLPCTPTSQRPGRQRTDTPVTASGLFVGSVSSIDITPTTASRSPCRILEKNHRLIREDSTCRDQQTLADRQRRHQIKAGSPTSR